jgi:hypothetical protein
MKILRILVVIGVLFLFLASFSEVPRTFAILNVSWISVLTSGDLDVLFRQVRTPRAGEHVLPPAVQAGISLLRANQVTAYRFSMAFEQNEEIRQRLLEGAYPLRYEKDAHYLLLLEQETPDRNCSQISRGGGVVLVHCP